MNVIYVDEKGEEIGTYPEHESLIPRTGDTAVLSCVPFPGSYRVEDVTFNYVWHRVEIRVLPMSIK